MINTLLSTISYLRSSHHLVLIRHCGSAWQLNFLQRLLDGQCVVDLSDPALREQASWQPGAVAAKVPAGSVLLNLQYAPAVAQHLQGDGYLGVVTQSAVLDCSAASLLDLPLTDAAKKPFVQI